MFFGYPTPPDPIAPQNDPSFTKEQRSVVFSKWVTSYFQHPFYQVEQSLPEKSTSNLFQAIPEGVAKYRPPSIESFTKADIESCIEVEAGDKDLKLFMKLSQRAVHDLTFGTFFDNNSDLDIKVTVIYGRATIWMALWAVWKLEEELDQWRTEGKDLREIELAEIPGGNHFVSSLYRLSSDEADSLVSFIGMSLPLSSPPSRYSKLPRDMYSLFKSLSPKPAMGYIQCIHCMCVNDYRCAIHYDVATCSIIGLARALPLSLPLLLHYACHCPRG